MRTEESQLDSANRLIDLQLDEIVRLKEQIVELREAAIACIHKSTGNTWRGCDEMLAAQLSEVKSHGRGGQ